MQNWIIIVALVLGGISEIGLGNNVPSSAKTSTQPHAVKNHFQYDGWVRIQADLLDESGTPMKVDESEKPAELYINQKTGQKCQIMNMGDHTVIRFIDYKKGEIAEYNSKDKIVAFGVTEEGLIQSTRKEIADYPLTLELLLTQLKNAGAVFLNIDDRLEGNLRRVEVTYISGQTCKTCPDQGGRDIFWVDPRTSLIQKMNTRLDPPQEITYTYEKTGKKKDIFDFGVPRSTTVRDCRPTPEANKVLDRLDTRSKKGFGNHIAIMTETDHRKEWGGATKMYVYLFMRENDKVFYAIYGLNEKAYADAPIKQVADWPKPDIKSTLDLASKTIPLTYYAYDGKKVWVGSFDTYPDNKSRMIEGETTFNDRPIWYNQLTEYQVWRNRESLFLYGYGPSADVVTDKSLPNLVGLRLRDGDFSEKPKSAVREERLFWIDPKRDDVPVKAYVRGERFDPSRRLRLTIFDTQYLEYARLPNGQWYPTHWKYDASREDFVEKSKGGFGREFFLQIFPDMKVDPAWFASRAKAMEIKAEKMRQEKLGH